MASFFGLTVAVASILWAAAPAAAQQPAGQVVKLGEGETLTITGFISATLFTNRNKFGAFGQGQNAEYAAQVADTTDRFFTDGDVRNTRINFTFNAGPVLGKWSPRGVLEADFFGQQGALPFGDEQPQLRVRFAYADLTNGRTTIRIGQYWSPLFGETPVSLSHIAFPIGYGASGKVGWRFPGVFVYHDLTSGKPVVVQLQLAAFEGSGPANGAAGDTAAARQIGTGEASGLPQLEALLNFTKRSAKLSWNVYVVGHVDWKDTSGTNRPGNNLTGVAFEVGGNIVPGKFSLRGNFYYGKAIGQQFGHITQFAQGNGNIRGYGVWAQAGYDFTPRWSYFLYYGIDNPDEVRFAQDNPTAGALARQENQDAAALLRFRAGRYALGLEYLRAMTRYNTGLTNAQQFALSVLYTL